ncbi:MAG: Rab family GTPase [Promethearchaeota archaeon]
MARAEESYQTNAGVNKKHTFVYKVIVAGEGGVGKTTLVNRYATGKFNVDTRVTIGVAFQVFEANGKHDEKIKLQLWDFGGEQRFRFLLPSYCNGAHGVILAFDLTRISSLLNLNNWIQLIKENTKNPVILLIGTKKDLAEENGKGMPDEFIHQFLSSVDLDENYFLKTSSKTGENVTNVFSRISSLILNAHINKNQQKNSEMFSRI